MRGSLHRHWPEPLNRGRGSEAGRAQREMHQDIVADGVGAREGEECKMPMVCLAWPPWMVTLFSELGEAHKKQV